MTPKELLIPRYRLYATYPNCPFPHGAILIEQQLGATINPYYEVDTFGRPNAPSLYNPENYPANFYLLDWWEFRNINELPEYLRDRRDGQVFKLEFVVVNGNPRINIVDINGKPIGNTFTYLTPATKEEYICYMEKYYIDQAQQAESFLNQNDIR